MNKKKERKREKKIKKSKKKRFKMKIKHCELKKSKTDKVEERKTNKNLN